MVMKFLLLIPFLGSAYAVLPDILQTCREINCDVDEEYSKYAAFNPDQNYKWIASGLPMIFWDAVRSRSLFNQSIVSNACRDHLVKVSNAMKSDSEWSYQFLDSSGKTGSLFKSTNTAYGDYDLCLSIHAQGVTGKYCMIDMHHLRKATKPGQLALVDKNVIIGYPYFSALCLPSSCQVGEVQRVVKQLLKPYLIKVAGHIHCDTADEITWYSKVVNLNTRQIVATSSILLILVLVVVSSLFRLVGKSTGNEGQASLLGCMSVQLAYHKLFYTKPYKYDILVFDSLKLTMILVSTLAHIVYCADSPLSYATFAHQSYLDYLWSDFWTQVSVNDTGLLSFPLLSGIASFMIMYPMAKKKKVPYFSAVLDRIARYLPHILIITACEFMWPIMGSGPFYTRVADFVLNKCNNNWWLNLFFINNYFIEGIDICAGHSFWSSIDMHLFLLGLIGIYIFSISDAAGVAFSISMIVFGILKTTYNAWSKETIFSIYVVDPDPFKTNEYFTEVYSKTPMYIPSYFSGFLVAYLQSKGHLLLDVRGRWKKIAYILFCCTVFQGTLINYALGNTFHVYTKSMYWLLCVIGRNIQLVGYIAVYVFCSSMKPEWEEARMRREATGGHCPKKGKESFSLFKALCRVCLSLYICNYLYIRYEFFTRRFLHPNGNFWLIKRVISSTLILYLFALLFHLMLLGPVDSLRDHLMKSGKSKRQPDEVEKVPEVQEHIPLQDESKIVGA